MSTRRFPRFLRLRLRTLILAITALCVLLGALVSRAKRQADSIAALRAAGADVVFQFEVAPPGEDNMAQRLLRNYLGPEFFDDVHQIDLLGESAIRANVAHQERYGLNPVNFPFPPPKDGALMPLRGLKSVKRLRVRESAYYRRLAEIGLASVAGLSDLERLEIHVKGVTDEELYHLRDLKKLTHLELIGDVTEAGLRNLTGLVNLRTLSMGRLSGRDNSVLITDEGAASLGELPQLQSLGIVRFELTDDGVTNLSQLTRLRDLDLSGNNISDSAAHLIGRMTQLRMLNLNHTKISDATVCEFGGLANLEFLALCGTGITDKSLPIVSRLPRLRELYVSGTQISDAGAAELRASKTIQVLDISYCSDVSDRSIDSLRTLPLWSLNTIGSSVSEQGKDTLRKAIPSLNAIH